MKILLLNYEFPPMGGGAGRATYNIAKELVRLGHQVDVLTSRQDSQKAKEMLQGVTVYRVRILRNSVHDCGYFGAFLYVLFAYFKLLELCSRKNYDILHYFFGLPTGLLALLPGKHRETPYIVSLRGSDVPHYDPRNPTLDIAHRIMKPLTIKIWRRAKQVVALSPSLRLTSFKTDPTIRVDVIRNGINCEQFFPTTAPKHGKTLRLITVSRLIERKGIEDVLSALAQIGDPGIYLEIVGIGNYEHRLKEVCKQYGIEDRVNFFGYCPNESVGMLYRANDVFILTSLAESFGMVFLEAMACGLPVIGTRIGGIPGIVSSENGILVDPGSISQIKEAILRMRDHERLREEMGVKNRLKVMEHFSWRHVAEAYQYHYINSISRSETIAYRSSELGSHRRISDASCCCDRRSREGEEECYQGYPREEKDWTGQILNY